MENVNSKKVARWLDGKCTACGWEEPDESVYDGYEESWEETPYCPNCGARMILGKPLSASLMERSIDDGFTKESILQMLQDLCAGTDEELLPVCLEGDSSSAFGFIRMSDADAIDFQIGPDTDFGKTIRKIMDDMSLENPEGLYEVCGLKVHLMR